MPVITGGIVDEGTAVISGTMHVSGTIAGLSDNAVKIDGGGDVYIDADSGTTVFMDGASPHLSIINSSNSAAFFPVQADLQFWTQSSNISAEVDSSDDCFRIKRKLGLGFETITNTDGTASTTAPLTTIIAGDTNNRTLTLGDPTFHGQIKVVVGMQQSSGTTSVAYTNAGGTTTTKTLTPAIAVLFLGMDMTGSGGYRWVVVGDVS